MADYKESNIDGVTWTRACRVVINNPHEGPKTVHFHEESVVSTLVGAFTLPGDVVAGEVTMTGMIDLIDPNTLQPLGQSIPESTMYLALFSKYIQLAQARDQANQPVQAPPAVPDGVNVTEAA